MTSAIRLEGWTCAYQIAIAICVVNPGDRRPVLVDPQPGRRKRRLLPRIGTVPFCPCDCRSRVRGILERVIDAVHLSGLDRGDLLANRDHRPAEPIELVPAMALGGLDHPQPGVRERQCRRVEAEVHEPGGDFYG